MKRFLALLFLLPLLAVAQSTAPFTPVAAGTTTISCTNASAATAINTKVAQQPAQLLLTSPIGSAATAFLEFGISTQTAAVATGFPLLPGQSMVITVSPLITHVACITAASTATVYVSVGAGN